MWFGRKEANGKVWERISKLIQMGSGKKQKTEKKREEENEEVSNGRKQIEMKTNQETV